MHQISAISTTASITVSPSRAPAIFTNTPLILDGTTADPDVDPTAATGSTIRYSWSTTQGWTVPTPTSPVLNFPANYFTVGVYRLLLTVTTNTAGPVYSLVFITVKWPSTYVQLAQYSDAACTTPVGKIHYNVSTAYCHTEVDGSSYQYTYNASSAIRK